MNKKKKVKSAKLIEESKALNRLKNNEDIYYEDIKYNFWDGPVVEALTREELDIMFGITREPIPDNHDLHLQAHVDALEGGDND